MERGFDKTTRERRRSRSRRGRDMGGKKRYWRRANSERKNLEELLLHFCCWPFKATERMKKRAMDNIKETYYSFRCCCAFRHVSRSGPSDFHPYVFSLLFREMICTTQNFTTDTSPFKSNSNFTCLYLLFFLSASAFFSLLPLLLRPGPFYFSKPSFSAPIQRDMQRALWEWDWSSNRLQVWWMEIGSMRTRFKWVVEVNELGIGLIKRKTWMSDGI